LADKEPMTKGKSLKGFFEKGKGVISKTVLGLKKVASVERKKEK